MRTFCVALFLVALLSAASSWFVPTTLRAAGGKIVLLEDAKRLSQQVIRKTAKEKSQENPAGGYDANVRVLDCFARMEYRYYTGGRYVNEPIPFRLLGPDTVVPGETYPLIVCFHGKGESGDDNTRQLSHLHSTIDLLAGKNKLDLFILAIQCPGDNPYWNTSIGEVGQGDAPETVLAEILDAFIEQYPVDTSRIAAFGLCSGGNAAWRFVDGHPGCFAALAVCSAEPGNADPENFRNVSVWAFNNLDDETPFEPTRALLAEINALGGRAYATTAAVGGHDTWTRALWKNRVFGWLSLQSLETPGPPQGVDCVFKRDAAEVFVLFVLPILLIIVLTVVIVQPSSSRKRSGTDEKE